MRVAIFCGGFGGCRAKIHDLYCQLFGKENIAVYRKRDRYVDQDAPEGKTWDNPAYHVKEIMQYDVVHAFCDDTSEIIPLLSRAKQIGKKIIVHQHDIYSMRDLVDMGEPHVYSGPMSNSAVHVLTSQAHYRYLQSMYGNFMVRVMLNMPVASWSQEKIETPKIEKSMAYFGYITSADDKQSGYRFYADVWKPILDEGYSIYVYANGEAKQEWYDTYKTDKAYPVYFMPHIPHKHLGYAISRHTFGFVGYGDPAWMPKAAKKYAPTCVPNKAFEYMFAGIPTVGYNCQEASMYVNKWGACCDKTSDLPATIKKALEMDIDYDRLRGIYNMESQIPVLKGLIEEVAK